MQEAFDKAFGSWTEKEWFTFEKVYYAAIG